MTQYRIYGEPFSTEPVVTLRVAPYNESGALVAVDEHGQVIDGGYIAHLTPEGKLRLHDSCGVPGLQLDGRGRVKIWRADDE